MFEATFPPREIALMLGVHKNTLLRWERDVKIPRARRFARNGHRFYFGDDIQAIDDWMNRQMDDPPPVHEEPESVF